MKSKKVISNPEDALVVAKQKATRAKNHPFIVPVITLLVLFVVSSIVLVGMRGKNIAPSDAHVVLFAHDNKQETLPTRAKTVGEFLERTGVTLQEGDVVEPAKDTEIVEDNFRVNVYRARPVTIVDGGKKTFTLSAEPSTRTLAEQAGVTVYPEDIIEKEPARDFLQDGLVGEKVVISRAKPAYLNLYGTPVAVRTHAKTVGDLLKEKNVQVGEGDTVQPTQDQALTDQTQVFVLRAGTQLVSEEQSIAAPEEIVEDASLSFGTRVVRQKGVPGKRIVSYILDSATGEKKIIQDVVVSSPVKQVVARGKAAAITGDKSELLAAAGVPADQHAAANFVIAHESGWRLGARNAGGCLGLGQRCPGSVLIAACPNWEVDAICQIKHFSAYANGRYGGWNGAYEFWQTRRYW